MTEENLKLIVQEEIGNNDPFWNEPVLEIVHKIIEMPEGTETTISELINYESSGINTGLVQQTDIYNSAISVCSKIGISLEETKEGESAYLYRIKKTNSTSITLDEAKSLAEKELGCDGEKVINHIYETSSDYIFTAGIPGLVQISAAKLFYVNKSTRLGRIIIMTPEKRHDILEEIKESNQIL